MSGASGQDSSGSGSTRNSNKDAAIAEWNSRYKALEEAFYVPLNDYVPTNDGKSQTKVTVRKMVVDLEELYIRLLKDTPDWNRLEIYADVLIIPYYSKVFPSFVFRLGDTPGQSITIVARSIQVVDQNAVFSNFAPDVELNIYAHEIVGGEISYFGVAGDPTRSTKLNLENKNAGVHMRGSDTAASTIPEFPQNLVEVGSPAFWLLQSSFNTGAALAYSEPAIASSILAWTNKVAASAQDQDVQQLALSAGNMQGIVEQLQRKIPYVPPLDQETYKDLSVGYLAAAEDAEKNFNDQIAQFNNTRTWEGFVNADKAYFGDQVKVQDELLKSMASNVADAERVLTQNADKLNTFVKLDGSLYYSKLAFEEGITAYKKKKQKEAELAVLSAIVDIGGSIAKMAAGDEAEVANVGEIAEDVEKTADVAKKTISSFKKLTDAIKKIAAVIKKLADLIDKLNKAKSAVEKLLKTNKLEKGDFTNGIVVPNKGDSEIFDNAYWDVFKLTTEDIIKPYTSGDTEIDGASNYLENLKEVAIYGKAVYANQISLVQLNQKLLQLRLDKQTAKHQTDRLAKLASQEKKLEDRFNAAKVAAYQNLVRIKSKVIFHMDQHDAAFRYYAVEPRVRPDGWPALWPEGKRRQFAEQLPSLIDPVSKLGEKLEDVEAKRVALLTKLKSAPGDMDISIKISDPDLIENMRKSGELTWNLPLDQDEFSELGRIRIRTIRAYINREAVLDAQKTIFIEIENTSHYTDRFQDITSLEYVTNPFFHKFQYRLDQETPLLDGNISDEKEYSFFEPPPFTSWTIKLLNKEVQSAHPSRARVDLSKLNSIKLQFIGRAS